MCWRCGPHDCVPFPSHPVAVVVVDSLRPCPHSDWQPAGWSSHSCHSPGGNTATCFISDENGAKNNFLLFSRSSKHSWTMYTAGSVVWMCHPNQRFFFFFFQTLSLDITLYSVSLKYLGYTARWIKKKIVTHPLMLNVFHQLMYASF